MPSAGNKSVVMLANTHTMALRGQQASAFVSCSRTASIVMTSKLFSTGFTMYYGGTIDKGRDSIKTSTYP